MSPCSQCGFSPVNNLLMSKIKFARRLAVVLHTADIEWLTLSPIGTILVRIELAHIRRTSDITGTPRIVRSCLFS